MADYDLYDEDELYEDEDEQAVEEEGTNRTFIIIAAALGVLLLGTVCVFLIWAFVINPNQAADRIAQNEAVAATNEAILAAAGLLTGTVAVDEAVTPDAPAPTSAPELADTAEPATATPRPATATPVPDTPTPAEAAGETPAGTAEETPAEATEAAPTEEAAEATPMEAAEATPEETTPAEVADAGVATPATTPTPRRDKAGVPETGIGTLAASAVAIGLLFLLVLVRRMRRAV